MLVPFLIGVVPGIFGVAKLIEWLTARYQLDFPWLLSFGKSLWPSASFFQAGHRSVPSFLPFPNRLTMDMIPYGCFFYSMMLCIQHHPLTKVGILCFLFHCREPFL